MSGFKDSKNKNLRKVRTTSLDNRLFVSIRILATTLRLNVNDLIEEGMVLVLEKYNIPDPRE